MCGSTETPLPLTFNFGRTRWSATWPMTLLTACAVLLFVDLGRWQWHRAEQKRALAAAFALGTRAVQPLAGQRAADLPRYAQVQANGRYDTAHQFLLDNMPQDGRTGYEVLTPLELTDGRVLIVNRGWVPMPTSRRELPDIGFDASSAESVRGRLDDLPRPGIELGHVPPATAAAWPKVTSFPTMADLSTALGRPLEGRQLLLNPDAPHGYARDWQPSGLTPERHLSYAAQWWTFAALALVLYAVLNRRARTP